jgi:hypothetical protein
MVSIDKKKDGPHKPQLNFAKMNQGKWKCCIHTKGGNIFSAALRGTENPPWVLVSLAVRVLQKNSVGWRFCLRPKSDASIASLSYCRRGKGDNLWYNYSSFAWERMSKKSRELKHGYNNKFWDWTYNLLCLQVEGSSAHRPRRFQDQPAPKKTRTSIYVDNILFTSFHYRMTAMSQADGSVGEPRETEAADQKV